MKLSRPMIVLFIAFLGITISANANAQSKSSSTTAPTQSEQLLNDLLTEVHGLRVAIQQMSVNAYRGQIMVERLRLQQEQVSRLTRDLSSIREEIAELKAQQSNFKERLEDAEKQADAGTISSTQLNDVRRVMTDLKRREQSLNEREAELSNSLNQERATLNELNNRLDSLEKEIVMTGLGDDAKKPRK
jgi:chromosome segregation ATPase